jgi:hypothetical protein
MQEPYTRDAGDTLAPMKNLALWLSVLVALGACGKSRPAPAAPAQEAAAAEPEPPAPLAEPGAEESSARAAPPEEAATDRHPWVTLFHTDTRKSTPYTWKQGKIAVVFSVAPAAAKDGKIPVSVQAAVGRKRAVEVFRCEGLDATMGASADVLIHEGYAHVRCLNPAHVDDPGAMQALRLRFDAQGKKLVPAGTYGGEGIVDPDTVDLDER